jgi:Cys-tRNA(Pro) deacylase
MAGTDFPVTTAIRALRELKIPYTPHLYPFEEHGGTGHAAAALGVDEHRVIKTLIMQTDERRSIVVLMHGDREVSTKQLARAIGARRVDPCDPATVTRLTGYMVGGVSPFGTRTRLQIFVERTILDLPGIYINGGKRGFLVEIAPHHLVAALSPTPVDAAILP